MHMQNDQQTPESYTLKRAAIAPAQRSDWQQASFSSTTRCQMHLSQLQTKAAWLHVAAAAAAAAITNVLVGLIC